MLCSPNPCCLQAACFQYQSPLVLHIPSLPDTTKQQQFALFHFFVVSHILPCSHFVLCTLSCFLSRSLAHESLAPLTTSYGGCPISLPQSSYLSCLPVSQYLTMGLRALCAVFVERWQVALLMAVLPRRRSHFFLATCRGIVLLFCKCHQAQLGIMPVSISINAMRVSHIWYSAIKADTYLNSQFTSLTSGGLSVLGLSSTINSAPAPACLDYHSLTLFSAKFLVSRHWNGVLVPYRSCHWLLASQAPFFSSDFSLLTVFSILHSILLLTTLFHQHLKFSSLCFFIFQSSSILRIHCLHLSMFSDCFYSKLSENYIAIMPFHSCLFWQSNYCYTALSLILSFSVLLPSSLKSLSFFPNTVTLFFSKRTSFWRLYPL